MKTLTAMTMKSITTRPIHQVALAALLCVLGSTHTWASPGDAPSVTVSFRDLDLSSIAGATALYHRIQGAARQVCGQARQDLLEQSIWRACYRNATADAVRKVNSPLLTAVHTGRASEMTAMVSK
jgi:UrcA family protein